MFIAPSMTSHEKSSAAQRSRLKMPSTHALRQMVLTVRVRAMGMLILSPDGADGARENHERAHFVARGTGSEGF